MAHRRAALVGKHCTLVVPVTLDQRAAILESLTAGASLASSLRGAGVTRGEFAAECERDPAFATAAEDARQAGIQSTDTLAKKINELRKPIEPAKSSTGIATPPIQPRASPDAAKPATAAKEASRTDWSRAAQVSAEISAEEAQRMLDEAEEQECEPNDRWMLARYEAAAIEPGHIGTLLWIDARCQKAGMHALDPWHVDDMRLYYASKKPVQAERIGLRGAKSVTKCRALVNDALFETRNIDQSVVGVIPVMSADRTEATDRFHTIRAVLLACGVASTKKDDAPPFPGGLMSEFTSSTLPSGGGVIKTVDSQGHVIEFRIYPARITGAIGYTAVAGLCDEVDLWPVDLGVSVEDVASRSAKGRANPADVVLDRLLERFTTTLASAHLYIVSASYRGQDSAHARKIAEGDTTIQRVARLGAIGAERDKAARRRLAEAIGSTDPRLFAPADPMSTDIPAWVSNPAAPIEACYALSRNRIGPMFGRYGGRPDEAEGAGLFTGVEFPVQDGSPRMLDVVVGLAPDAKAWGRAVVAMIGDAFLVLAEDMGPMPFALPAGVSVIACAASQEAALRAEMAAHATAHAGPYLPPVAPQNVYDGSVLRLSPLRLLYLSGRLRHARGLNALESALRGHHEDAERSPRVEALAVAVARLVACYPWLGAPGEAEPVRGPRARPGMLDGGEDMRRSMAGPDGFVRRA